MVASGPAASCCNSNGKRKTVSALVLAAKLSSRSMSRIASRSWKRSAEVEAGRVASDHSPRNAQVATAATARDGTMAAMRAVKSLLLITSSMAATSVSISGQTKPHHMRAEPVSNAATQHISDNPQTHLSS